MDRRKFLKYNLLGSMAMGVLPAHLYASEAPSKVLNPSDEVVLGNTNIRTSRMAMGTGTRGFGGSSNQTRQLGIKGLPDLLHAAYEEGITFWDSADQYGSHPHVKKALQHVPREKVTILSKTHAESYDDMKKDLDRFRKEMGTDYIDIILLHAVKDPQWNIKHKGAMEALVEAREEGIIKAHGVSCHSIGALKTAAEEPWVMVDLARFNPAGASMDDDVPTVRKVLQRMKANGKAIIAMKVYGAGKLVNRKDEALKFQANHDFVDAFTLGIENYDQFKDIQRRLPAVTTA